MKLDNAVIFYNHFKAYIVPTESMLRKYKPKDDKYSNIILVRGIIIITDDDNNNNNNDDDRWAKYG